MESLTLAELDGHMAEAAQAYHGQLVAGLVQAIVLHGGVGGDARAQQGRRSHQRQVLWNLQRVPGKQQDP